MGYIEDNRQAGHTHFSIYGKSVFTRCTNISPVATHLTCVCWRLWDEAQKVKYLGAEPDRGPAWYSQVHPCADAVRTADATRHGSTRVVGSGTVQIDEATRSKSPIILRYKGSSGDFSKRVCNVAQRPTYARFISFLSRGAWDDRRRNGNQSDQLFERITYVFFV